MSKERKRRAGEFQKKRAARQRQARIYEALRAACAEAQKNGTAQVVIDNRRFCLSSQHDAPGSGDGYYTSHVLLRLRGWGIVYAHINEKDSGYVKVHWPVSLWLNKINSWAWERIAAYVTRIEDARTGVELEQPRW